MPEIKKTNKPKNVKNWIERTIRIPENIYDAMELLRGDTPRNTFMVRAIRDAIIAHEKEIQKIDVKKIILNNF